MVVWRAANGICSKRLVPFLPELVPILEGHGHLTLDDEVRAQLLSMSAATADRMVRRLREADRPHGISTTKPGRLLKRQVPVRTFGEWDDLRPGFFEADLVAHCGGYTDGAFLYTLCLTDVATGWTECLPLLHRIPSEVVQAVRQVRQAVAVSAAWLRLRQRPRVHQLRTRRVLRTGADHLHPRPRGQQERSVLHRAEEWFDRASVGWLRSIRRPACVSPAGGAVSRGATVREFFSAVAQTAYEATHWRARVPNVPPGADAIPEVGGQRCARSHSAPAAGKDLPRS